MYYGIIRQLIWKGVVSYESGMIKHELSTNL